MIALFTLLAILCFAANSLLCRAALSRPWIDATAFTFVRLATGAITLFLILTFKRRFQKSVFDWRASFALVAYALFFSFAYRRIDAGVGALILFGTVQLTMIGWNFVKSLRPSLTEWIGLSLALMGLAFLTLPGKSAPDFWGLMMMAIAGFAWGVYSLRGKSAKDPLLATAWNFICGTILAAPSLLFTNWNSSISGPGILLAALSGSVTSGIGYSLWYTSIPHLPGNRAAIVQLSVPVIAALGATLWLHEMPSTRLIVCGTLILSGVGVIFLKR